MALGLVTRDGGWKLPGGIFLAMQSLALVRAGGMCRMFLRHLPGSVDSPGLSVGPLQY